MARTKSANPRTPKSAKSSVSAAEQHVTPTNGLPEGAVEKKLTETLTQPSAAKSARQKSQNGARSQNGAAKVSDEQIRERAYQLYLERGRQHGSDEDDWYRAETELRGHSR